MKNYCVFLGLVVVVFLVSCLPGTAANCELPKPDAVKAIGNKVASWQINTFEEMGKYRSLPALKDRKSYHHRDRYSDLDWTCATLYAGMYNWGVVSGKSNYTEWLWNIGERNNWQLYTRMYHADDHAVGQMYLDLALKYKQAEMYVPTKVRFDSIMISEKGKSMQWWWSDALFMAPPVWARLTKVTNDSSYLNYMDIQYRKTYDLLWDKEEHLFWRDKSFFAKREKNGRKLFWSRGNGWVFGGLALMIPDLPQDWSSKPFYINLFKEMAVTIKNTQRADGTWSSGLLADQKDYPVKETSGSAFYVFGLFWGMNQGLLDKATYEPIALKGWKELVKCINKVGMLGYVQGVGAAPGDSFKNYTEVYAIGAFLAANTEMYKYVGGK